jgi:type I restriction enzyme S subunit
MNGKFWVNNHAHILQAIKGKTRNDFLMYLLNYMDLHTYIVGSTRVKLNQEDLKKIQIKLPPLLEQQKIVEILSTADKVIEKIDQMIEKIEKLKRDLIKELLTKGIWHKEFKDTERSRIPKKCETFKISDILKLEYGESLTQTERQKGGFPVLGSNGIVGYHNQSLVKGPGIVIGRKGSIGVVKWIEEDFWPIDTTYYVVLINKSIVLKWLSYKLGSLNLNNLNMATGVPGLNRDIVYAINLQVPDTQEQEKIVNIIETIEKRIDLLMNKKNIYIKIRKQLMNDLLTNKLEVNHAK